MPTQLQMLGAPRVCVDGRTVAIAWQRRTLDLLTYLFTSRGAEPRDAVAFALWPDDDEETARAHLRRNLNVLRTLLPPDVAAWIVADAGIVAFAHDVADTDVAAFEAALDAGDRAAAVRLYGGDFAAASAEPYALTERERLRGRYHAALLDLIGSEFSARRFDAALGYARRIFADEPFREDIVRRVIAIRYAMGDRPGALAEYDRFARSLRGEMQIDPMPETTVLRDLILRGDPLPFAPDARPLSPGPSGAASTALLPFVGRTRTLDMLRAGWESAAGGAGTAAFVCGEAGIGKTRVVAEFLERSVGAGARVLRGTTASPEARPYEALAMAFAAAAPFIPTLELEAVWLVEIAHLVPEVGARISVPSRVALPPDREAARSREAFARFTVGAAQRGSSALPRRVAPRRSRADAGNARFIGWHRRRRRRAPRTMFRRRPTPRGDRRRVRVDVRSRSARPRRRLGRWEPHRRAGRTIEPPVHPLDRLRRTRQLRVRTCARSCGDSRARRRARPAAPPPRYRAGPRISRGRSTL
jgi:DNA-binding SARP family transcriptional activator